MVETFPTSNDYDSKSLYSSRLLSRGDSWELIGLVDLIDSGLGNKLDCSTSLCATTSSLEL